MNSFTQHFVDNPAVPLSITKLLVRISEYRGRQDLFQRQLPEVLDTLRQHSIIQSTESSNRLEGITVSSRRFDSIMKYVSEPRNRPEAEIAGYRDVLRMIHEHHEHMNLSPNLILQLHRDLMKYVRSGGHWKKTDNTIEEVLPTGERRTGFVPVPAWQTPDAVERLCRTFLDYRQQNPGIDLIPIGYFVLDFLSIHPFSDGNGRMARLLSLLLLYQSGYVVGRYISLEQVIEDTRAQYYDTLYRSSQGWHEAKHNPMPWLEYFLTVVLEAYRRFEERVGAVREHQKRGWKQARIEEVVHRFMADFTISDVEKLCPGISRPTITRVLNKMSKGGYIRCIEKGRNARWVKNADQTADG